ncbi:MAG: hypothetical protein OQJ96_07110 [Flavobacteriales bacterium]|nr:hypothetical protein [Flavobacteriales bacterium]MCW8913567.1 hypothetical protein [Flavobacteriales bacterium]MCW8936614.1 hypothetical protein [Flavobacteriales bacterium]MCW8967877.1 hypothetical protein [Flavobacteriales bacterium]MCW8990640.1 hypothetical protein [Flavobacteriales bacterium]
MKTAASILSILIVSLFLGCVKNAIEPVEPTPTNTNTIADENITYNKTIKPIIDQNCGGCHHPQTLNILPYLTNYEEVKFEAENGTLVSTIFDANPRLMPPSNPLLNKEKELITKWINLNYPK